MSPFNRRSFLLGAGAGMSSLALLGSLNMKALGATPSSDTILVHVFLRGGADGLSLLRPANATSQFELYRALRPRRADGGIHIKNAVALENRVGSPVSNTPFAIHPNLTKVKAMFDKGQAVFIHGCGSLSSNRSHFEQFALIETGVAAQGVNTAGKTGYLNRALQQLGGASDLKGIAISPRLPIAMIGPSHVLGAMSLGDIVSLQDPSGGLKLPPSVIDREAWFRDGLADLYTPQEDPALLRANEKRLRKAAVAGGKGLDESELVRQTSALSGVYGKSEAGNAMRAAAEAVKVQLEAKTAEPRVRVVAVDIDHFDTHALQGSDEHPGRLPKLLSELDMALGAFAVDILDKPIGAKVVVVVQTEFGRTAAENGTQGTDHGRGGVMMVLGHASRLNANRQRTVLAPDFDLGRLQDARDVRVTVDYRDVVQEILTRHLGVPEGAIGGGAAPIFSNGLDPYTPKSWNILA